MNIIDIVKKNREEFDENFSVVSKEDGGWIYPPSPDAIKSFLLSSQLSLLEALKEECERMKKAEIAIEECENCGGDGYGKAWYGHGRATGDAWGDRYEPTGSVVFCKECSDLFKIGREWNGEEIWKRTSDSEEHSQIRINHITKVLKENKGYNSALSDLLSTLQSSIDEIKKIQ